MTDQTTAETKEKIKESSKTQEVSPVEMPGYKANKKPCDLEVVVKTMQSFEDSENPSKKEVHLASLALLAKEIGKASISLPSMFTVLEKSLSVEVAKNATDSFRTFLYDDYYPQTRKAIKKEVKGIEVEKYVYDNNVHCTIPLVEDIERSPRRLWGFRFKPDFIKAISEITIDTNKLARSFRNL